MTETPEKLDLAPPRLTVIFAADVAGYSAMLEADDAKGLAEVERLFLAFKACAAEAGGRFFSRKGDGFFAEFPSAVSAIRAALAFHDAQKRLVTDGLVRRSIKTRQAVHLGEVRQNSGGDLFGHGVNMADRLQRHALTGGILVSRAIVDIVREESPARFMRRGVIRAEKTNTRIEVFDVAPLGAMTAAQRAHLKWRIWTRKSGWLGSGWSVVTFVGMAAALFLALYVTDQNATELARAQQIEQLERRVADLVEVAERPPATVTDIGRGRLLKDAMTSLLSSRSPAKQDAIALIEAGQTREAVATLETFLAALGEGVVDERLGTLREIAALTLTSDPRRARAAFKQINELAPGEPAVLDQLGRLSSEFNEFDSAREFYQALQQTDPDDPVLRASALLGLGRAHLKLNELDDAQHFLADAKAEVDQMIETADGEVPRPYLLMSAEIENKMGAYFSIRGDLDAAVRHRRRALVVSKSIGDLIASREALESLAGIARLKGDYPAALGAYAELDLIMQAADDRDGRMWFLYNWGTTAVSVGDTSLAQRLLDQALTIGREINHPEGITLLLLEKARLHKGNGEISEACNFAEEGATLALTSNNSSLKALRAEMKELNCPAT